MQFPINIYSYIFVLLQVVINYGIKLLGVILIHTPRSRHAVKSYARGSKKAAVLSLSTKNFKGYTHNLKGTNVEEFTC